MNGANLLPRHMVHARAMRARRTLWLRGGGAYAALVLGATLWLSVGSGLEPARLSAEVAELTDRRGVLERDAETLRARNAALRTKVEAARAVGRQPDWSVMLDALASMMGDAIALERLELLPPADRATAPTITLRGVGDSPREAADFALRLEHSRLFSVVTLSETRPRVVAGTERAEFSITGTLDVSSPPDAVRGSTPAPTLGAAGESAQRPPAPGGAP